MRHPHDKPAWMVSPVDPEYYRARAKGNWLILTAILTFVAFTVGMVMWKFDTAEFIAITQEHEAEQQRIEAVHEALEAQAVREGEAAGGIVREQGE